MADLVVNGVRFNVHHLSTGEPTVVFLHGLVVDNASSWYYTIANPVAQHAQVVLYDLRGHGLSDRPDSGYDVDQQVDDLFGILDGLGITGPVHLVGNSFGGVLALHAAVHRPERVAGLILAEAHVSIDGWREQMVGTLEFAGLFLDHDDVQGWLDAVGGRKGKRLARNSDILLHKTTLVEDLAESKPFTPAELNGVTCPVLIICGEHSDVRDWAERLVTLLPSCELHLYVGCSHIVLLEAPGDMRVDILAWMNRVAAGKAPEVRATGDDGLVVGEEHGRDRIVHVRAGEARALAGRPPWYPPDAPWPPVAGTLPDGWQEVMDEFAQTRGLEGAPVIPDHREYAPGGIRREPS